VAGASDPNIADGKNTGCAAPWTGGFPGFLSAVSATATLFNGQTPGCQSSPRAIPPSGSLDCWLPVDWDLDGRRRRLAGERRLAAKLAHQARGRIRLGLFHAFSREASCVGLPAGCPRLIVTLNGQAPVLADPPPNCDTYP
jgi:hypothetical protein